MTGPAFGDIEKRTDIKFILEKKWTFQDTKIYYITTTLTVSHVPVMSVETNNELEIKKCHS